ncbi:hypothetical protein NU688_30815 [Variovorax sp. ZS18.2.2]|uniref:hypothetical protein n=1 Tax=Variovorax sp. ZS18.2.2 TaxID=2971255 RepID=UPI002151AF3C|nr:hypothetical protein [Variovorax sp. ZS18.2.2]MCR6480581.1 hypothetical protein [Variovorax sp. ZS18.2.2]
MADRTRLYPGVSFMTHGSGFTDANLFDVPDEDYFDGSLTGIKAAWELLHAASNGDFDEGVATAVLRNALEEAAHVLDSTSKSQVPSRRGAAVGFLDAMAGALADAVKAWNFRPTLTRDIRGYEQCAAGLVDDMKTANAAFIESMSGKSVAKRNARPGRLRTNDSGTSFGEAVPAQA